MDPGRELVIARRGALEGRELASDRMAILYRQQEWTLWVLCGTVLTMTPHPQAAADTLLAATPLLRCAGVGLSESFP